jgi:hypothetical protein
MMCRDKTKRSRPQHRTWTVVIGRLRLTGWADPTDEADDSDRVGSSILAPLVPYKEEPLEL